MQYHKMYELTNPQKIIWNMENYFENTPINNICTPAIVYEKINKEFLEKAINNVVKKNDNFRIQIDLKNNIPMQYITEYTPFNLEFIQIKNESELKKIEIQEATQKFKVLNSALFRFKIAIFEDNHFAIILTVNHLIADSWALGLVIKNILKEYHYLINNTDHNNTELKTESFSYVDYINSEQEYKKSEKYNKDKAYWDEVFSTIPEQATIPSLKRISSTISSCANRESFTLDIDFTQKLKIFCQKNKISMFNLLMAIYSIYISRVSNLEDIVIGTPILNRTNYKEKNTIGMFVNMVPVRINLTENIKFTDFSRSISANLMGVLRHQKYSYSQILEDIRAKNSNISSLYNVLISYQITKAFDDEYGKYKTDWIFNNHCSSDFNIHIMDINDTGEFIVNYDYLTDKYEPQDIKNLHNHIKYILEQILENENIFTNDIEIITKEEKNKIIYDFNKTQINYAKNKTIVDFFEEQVENNPNKIAVVCNNQKLTYKELNERANSLAYYLRNTVQIKPNELVGFMVNRSIEIMVCIIGIIKAGGAYVPIDPTYPEDRISYMLESSKIKILLTQKALNKTISFKNKLFIDLSDTNVINKTETIKNTETNTLYFNHKDNLPHVNTPQDLAYVIFTSGSTGLPKGVMLKHSNAINLKVAMQSFFNFSNNTIASLATISFDMFVLESLVATILGLKIVIANNDEQININLFKDLCLKNDVDILQTTPSRMQSFMLNTQNTDFIKNAKYILVGGEPFPVNLLDKFKEITTAKIYNMYGPTETTVWSSGKELKNSENINIGKPLANTQIYILNKNLKPQPVGVCGEIYISGDGVGKGYLNNEKLTKNSFMPNPFIPNTLMYKTGDLGLFNNEGEIICLGRVDNQVKVRGLRIELGEIENKINKLEYIEACAVVKKTDKNSHEFLCAYYTSKQIINKNDLRKYLNKVLPRYMVPNFFLQMDKLPYTTTGKIDRKKLPEPQINTTNKSNILPRNKIDIKLIEIIKNLIKTNSISIEDSFFEIGGDSLSAINLCAEVQNEFNVQLFVKDVLENSVIKDLSDVIAKNTNKTSNQIIKNIEKADFYPVSSAQKRMYFASQIAGNTSTLYNIPGGLLITGILDIKKLEKCFNILINRHETLRTYFELENGEVVQKINLEEKSQKNNYFNLPIEKNANIKDLPNIFKKFLKPFDLSKAPLFRAKLISFNDCQHALLIDMHHIISDGTSLSIMANDLCKLYNDESLPELKITYKDFACYENEILTHPTDSIKDAENYWLNQFKNDIPVLSLPTKSTRPAIQSYEGKKVYSQINSDTLNKINELSKTLEVTPYMILLACYYILLSKYSSSEDIVVGSPIVGRDIAETYNLIGMFVNTLALRNNVNNNLSFKEFVLNLKENVLKAFQYQTYPYDELVNKLNIKRDTSRNPLFDTMFIYQNNGYKNINLKWTKSTYYIPDTGISKFDLSLEAVPEKDIIKLSFEYATQLFDNSFIENLAEHYLNILNIILTNINTKIYDINMLSKEEEQKILYNFNNTSIDYPKDKTIINLFEEQVKKTPNNIAIIFENQELTYKELNEKANSLAYYLRNTKKIQKNDLVGIMVNRSLEMIVCILAVLKAGGAYIPIDPTYPEDRIKYMLDNSNAKALLIQNKLQSRIDFANGINIDLDNSDIYNLPVQNLKHINNSEDLAYVIYTSGSTGLPKGVMLKQKNIINFINGMMEEFNFDNTKTIVSITTISFDIFVLESLFPLLNGLKVIIANEKEQTNSNLFNKLCLKHNVDIIQTTPSRMKIFMQNVSDLNFIKNATHILIGGEPFPKDLLKNIKQISNCKIYNMYGPTETAVWSTLKDLSNTNTIDIGKPISNTQIYILDKNLKPQPIGVPGEIYISGDGVSKGYLNNKEITNKNFIPNPFIKESIMYKTGDLGVFKDDGSIVCLGRTDNQIKIRGLRIELGEIEDKINAFSFISACAVVKRVINQSHEVLCAYFTANKKVEPISLRNQLENFLPKYMVPQYYIQLEELPYTPNGKIDRKKLPDFELPSNKKEIILARNNIDSKLLDILKMILSIDTISIDDNFFDLGGDSLSAINLCTHVEDKLNVQLFVKDILEHPVIQNLSDFISKKSNHTPKQTLKIIDKSDFYEVSSAQKRIFFASKVDGNNSILYNISGGIIFNTKLDFDKLQNCLNILINRHESLRTYFEINNNNVVQKILDNITFKLDTLYSANYKNLNNLFNDFIQPFDLSKAPLFRAKYTEFTNNKSALFIDMHHIISDGTSLSILTDELNKLYNDEDLPELKYTYKDFALFEKDLLNSDNLTKAKEYWINQFKDDIPILNLPTNYSRPAIQSFKGNKVYSSINSDTTKKIWQISKELGITPYMLLLSCYYILLSKYTSQNDIVVGTPIVGRNIAETENIIGMFVNTLALRNKINNNLTFKEFVIEIKNNILEAFKYQTYPFDELVNNLHLKRDASRNPLFDTMFTYQNNGYKNLEFESIKSKQYIPDTNISKFDLSIELIPVNNEIHYSFEYATSLFNEEFVKNMSNHYLNILNIVLENIDIQISDICILSKQEQNNILFNFNNTKVNYPKEKTIVKLFEEQVTKTPNNIAVIFENQQLTYKELNEKANSLAYYLRNNRNIKPNDFVGIMVNRSLEMIIAIIAVLKSGGAYIPIDPTYPKDRIEYMLKCSNANVVLIQKDLKNKIHFENTVYIDLNNNDIYNLPIQNLDSVNKPDDLSYVIFTSGSTGTPKGVMLKHKALSNLTNYCNNYIDYLKNPLYKSVVSITTISFDIFIFETLISLQKGLKLVIANEDEQNTPTLLNNLIEKHDIKIIQATPSRMQIFLNRIAEIPSLKSLEYITLAGEQLPLNLVNQIQNICNAVIYNGYGPSETTVFSTLTKMNNKIITIGKPLDNTQIYILDNHLNPVPVGVSGEIYISGDGVGKGYLNNLELTNKSFIPNPFIKDTIMYKSGDLGKYMSNGDILCLGRADNQVKIRGLRIELDEIESLILNYPNINKVTVIKQTKDNRDFISAYFVSTKPIIINELRKYLASSLPRYMVPSYFIQLDDFPYTPNGKIDKKALNIHSENLDTNKEQYIEPKTQLQKELVRIWEKILSTKPIGIKDNFFELGGDSLLAMNLNLELLKISDKITYQDIFRYPTISELEEKILFDKDKPLFNKIENLSDNFVDVLANSTKKQKSEKYHPNNILLTGSTGFLGIHILREFIEHEQGKIYCIVRGKTSAIAKKRLLQKINYYYNGKYNDLLDKRIIVINGNISEPNFGLNETDTLTLAHSVDLIINSAAIVFHYGDYNNFYKTNVESVKYIADFCNTFNKKLYHISTKSITGTDLDLSYPSFKKSKRNKLIKFNESHFYTGQIIDNLYARSKFEAEKYLLNAISNGLNAYILRMGNLMPRYSDGLFQENALDNDFINRIISFIKLGFVPIYLLNYKLELTPVDYAAQAIYHLINNPTNNNRIFHLYNHKNITVEKFLKSFQKKKYRVSILTENNFKNKINMILNDDKSKYLLKTLINDLDKNLHLNYKSSIIFNSKFTVKYLKRTQFKWPKITNDYLTKLIKLINEVI